MVIGEYVKLTIDGEVRKCEALCFMGWNSTLNDSKTSLTLKPQFLGYYHTKWPYWLEALFLHGVLELVLDLVEDTPSLLFNEMTTVHNVEERDIILRYRTSNGDIKYKYMSRADYDAADKEEYHEIKL